MRLLLSVNAFWHGQSDCAVCLDDGAGIASSAAHAVRVNTDVIRVAVAVGRTIFPNDVVVEITNQKNRLEVSRMFIDATPDEEFG